jgi:hypothetical protein
MKWTKRQQIHKLRKLPFIPFANAFCAIVRFVRFARLSAIIDVLFDINSPLRVVMDNDNQIKLERFVNIFIFCKI